MEISILGLTSVRMLPIRPMIPLVRQTAIDIIKVLGNWEEEVERLQVLGTEKAQVKAKLGFQEPSKMTDIATRVAVAALKSQHSWHVRSLILIAPHIDLLVYHSAHVD